MNKKIKLAPLTALSLTAIAAVPLSAKTSLTMETAKENEFVIAEAAAILRQGA